MDIAPCRDQLHQSPHPVKGSTEDNCKYYKGPFNSMLRSYSCRGIDLKVQGSPWKLKGGLRTKLQGFQNERPLGLIGVGSLKRRYGGLEHA